MPMMGKMKKAISSTKGQKFVKNICKISEKNRFQQTN